MFVKFIVPCFPLANDRAVLLASDVAARGLDIPNVEHVIHYQVPQTVEVRDTTSRTAIFLIVIR